MTKRLIAAVFVVSLISAQSANAQQTTTERMSFEDCQKTITNAASDLGVDPINIVDMNDLRMVRFPITDGSVLVACSRPERTMVVTFSK
jgi:hypothetical protein